MHTEKINILIEKALTETKLSFKDLDAIAVTYGPGLEGALLVGITAAKTLAQTLQIPLIPTHHIAGHIYAHFLDPSPLPHTEEHKQPEFPFIALVVSGGHTNLIKVKGHFDFEIIGHTLDDAAGELFDKAARALGLGYPGGPVIEEEAKSGNKKAFNFPRAMLKKGYNFSFSGLKTAVITTIRALEAEEKEINTADISASLQQTISDILVYKTIRACKEFDCKTIVICGGVSANNAIKTTFADETTKKGYQFFSCPKILCTDNAAMIGAAAYYNYQKFRTSNPYIRVNPNAKLC